MEQHTIPYDAGDLVLGQGERLASSHSQLPLYQVNARDCLCDRVLHLRAEGTGVCMATHCQARGSMAAHWAA